MKLIVTSAKDIAGSNMYSLFSKEFCFVENGTYEGNKKYVFKDFVLIKVQNDILHIEHLNKEFKPEIYICASRHKSEQKHPSLTVHCTGNWNKAEHGGKEKELCINPACYLKKALCAITPIEGFDITLEVTHHGPSEMNAPLLFVEVGSSETEWDNIEACRNVCKAILSLENVDSYETVVGFGGPHYAPNFTKIMLETSYAVGHICPKHYADALDEGLVMQAIEKTVPKPIFAVLDWKGLTAEQRNKLIAIFEKNNLVWKKTKDLKADS